MQPSDMPTNPVAIAPQYESLLSITASLRRCVSRSAVTFNVFRVLRSPSDEVRLHSRFLAALMSPRGHACGNDVLQGFLEHAGIEGFATDSVVVAQEQWDIDILITNNKREAVLIENKIYATDQHRQLERYYQRLRSRFNAVHVIYLTLQGDDPSAHSVGFLREEIVNSRGRDTFQCLSYREHIVPWLERSETMASWDAGLKEAIRQYRDVVLELIGSDMNDPKSDALTQVLCEESRLCAARDIVYAYRSALVELQSRFWQEVHEKIRSERPEMSEHVESRSSLNGLAGKEAIETLVEQKRGFSGCGLYYATPSDISANVQVSICEEALAFAVGVRCTKDDYPDDYERITQALGKSYLSLSAAGVYHNRWWPYFVYLEQAPVHRREPGEDYLRMISNEDERRVHVTHAAELAVELWSRTVEA